MNKNKISGVYEIRNTIDGKRYIGSSTTLLDRKNAHFRLLRSRKHHSIYLQRSCDKYGVEVFEFNILCLCDPVCLAEREQYFIDTLHPEYNMAPTANSMFGYKLSAITRLRMSNAKKGVRFSDEHRANIGKANMGKTSWLKGKVCTEEHKRKNSEAHIGKRNMTTDGKRRIAEANRKRVITDETRKKLSESHMKKKNADP